MSYLQPQQLPPGVKPSLQGVRNKQRKGVTKAAAKFEPTAFRDQLIKHLESVPSGDFDAVATKLDALGNQLDYRKYEQQLFEILLVGGLLAPGGGYLEDGAARSPFSVLTSAKEPVEVADMRKIVDVFHRLMRRYKYLQKGFEDTVLKGVLQYASKFSKVDQDKLATATALFIQTGLANANVLAVLQKDHVTKDYTALNVLTTTFKAYLTFEKPDHLSASLRKGGLLDLTLFLPQTKRSVAGEFETHFRNAGLPSIVEYQNRIKTGAAKEETLARLKELVSDDAESDEVTAFLQQVHKEGVISEPELIAIVWHGLMASLDMGSKPDQLNEAVVKEVTRISPTLEMFCTKATSMVALINTIQTWAYENTKVMHTFARILKTLYSTDVVSDDAIIYWHSKGSRTQGRQHFLAATEPLVKFLKEQEDDDDEDSE